eukprot:1147523-Rhodomonas_salina.1
MLILLRRLGDAHIGRVIYRAGTAQRSSRYRLGRCHPGMTARVMQTCLAKAAAKNWSRCCVGGPPGAGHRRRPRDNARVCRTWMRGEQPCSAPYTTMS